MSFKLRLGARQLWYMPIIPGGPRVQSQPGLLWAVPTQSVTGPSPALLSSSPLAAEAEAGVGGGRSLASEPYFLPSKTVFKQSRLQAEKFLAKNLCPEACSVSLIKNVNSLDRPTQRSPELKMQSSSKVYLLTCCTQGNILVGFFFFQKNS